MSLADDSIAQRSERKGFRNELDMERAMGIDQIQPTKIKALLPASWFNWSQIGVNCCCEVTDRRQAGATYARFAAFASATRMITRLPSALAARVIVPSVTETFRGSSSLSNCERLV